MADTQRVLEDAKKQLANLQNSVDSFLDETVPNKLTRPWKAFRGTNDDLIEHAEHIIKFLKQKKSDEPDPEMQKDLEKLVKKWTSSVNNVYGGLVEVMTQCKTLMSTWDKVEEEMKDLKKLC